MVWGGYELVLDRFEKKQVLPALGWSRAWVYLAVPVAGVFIIGYSIRELIRPTPVAPNTPSGQSTGLS
jgi:TRAP-type C4-dicarboxylate transport system permease small subunit